jgi:IS4 transposase
MLLKKSIKYEHVKELPLPEDKDEHILKDEIIRLTEEDTKELYPENLNRVVIYDDEKNRIIEVITNNFSWTASMIAELYKQRWRIEIFFQELKQHLKIKSFIGISEDAMWLQFWTAVVSAIILKKQ